MYLLHIAMNNMPKLQTTIGLHLARLLLGALTFRDRCFRIGRRVRREGGRQSDRGETAQFASLIAGVNGSEVRLNRHFEVNKGCLLPINNK